MFFTVPADKFSKIRKQECVNDPFLEILVDYLFYKRSCNIVIYLGYNSH